MEANFVQELGRKLDAALNREDALRDENIDLRHDVGKLKDEREIEKTVDDEAILGYREENAKLREALERIQTWSEAYPLKSFPKPDLKKAHEVLKAADMTLGAISADTMRHVLNGVKDIVTEALKDAD